MLKILPLMQYQKLEFYISKPRLDRFLTACGGSKTRAQHLYQANLKVAESFYAVLNLFEVFLRNRINTELSIYFSNPDWILTEKNGFMNDYSLIGTKFYLKKEVLSAERRLTVRRKPISAGLVIAEQSLGFWTSLFNTHHYRVLSGSVIHCFPHKPSHVQRKQLNLILNDIRDFRNRIYHNEPVCFIGNNIDFSKVLQIRNNIYDVLNWMDRDTAFYVLQFDTILASIEIAQHI